MIYDEETGRWYLSISHLESCKRGLEANARLQKRLPLSREKAEEQAARWNAMPKKYKPILNPYPKGKGLIDAESRASNKEENNEIINLTIERL